MLGLPPRDLAPEVQSNAPDVMELLLRANATPDSVPRGSAPPVRRGAGRALCLCGSMIAVMCGTESF